MRVSIKRGFCHASATRSALNMKTPQLENGYVRIANEIVEKLAAAQLTGVEMQIVLIILRKTYGYSKKEDWISLGQFVQLTGRTKKGICVAIAALEEKGLIHTRRMTQKTFYSFNKDSSSWKVVYANSLVNTSTLVNSRSSASVLPVNRVVNASTHTKDNITKDKLQKTREFEKEIAKWFKQHDIGNPHAYLLKIRKTCSESAIEKAWKAAKTGTGVESPADFFKFCNYYSEQEKKKIKSKTDEIH